MDETKVVMESFIKVQKYSLTELLLPFTLLGVDLIAKDTCEVGDASFVCTHIN